MKILLIAHFVPWPPHGGSTQRNFNLLRELRKEFEIYMIGFTQRPHYEHEAQKIEAINEIKKYCTYLRAFDIPTDYSRVGWYSLLATNLFSRTPYSTWRFRSRAFEQELDRLLREEQFDIVYADTVATAPYALKAKGQAKLVLNHHNVESSLLLRRAANEPPPNRWYIAHQGKKLREWERRMCGQFDVNLTVSPLDADELRRLAPNTRYAVIPNGTDTTYFSPASPPAGNELVFAGTGGWYPNRDAMLWFCREIFSLVAMNFPDTILHILGSHPAPELVRAGRQDERIKIHGFVPDIRPYLERSAVYVAPIRVGGGTRLKILDAFAAGKAVVSTTIGCEGIECTDGRDIVVADTPEDFSRAVIELLRNSERRRQLGRQGRKLVEHMYGWDVIGERMRTELKKLL